MEMRTVYRYENAFGGGPYRSGSWFSSMQHMDMCDAHIGAHHPTWGADFTYDQLDDIGDLSEYLAACDSRESLDAWFDGWHDMLAANGFRVVEYTVPAENVLESLSGLQVAFLPMEG